MVLVFTQPDCRRYMPQSNLVFFLEEHPLAFRSIFGDICHGKCLIENNVLEPPNLKIFCGRIPHTTPTRLVHSALVIMPPLQKPSNGPVHRNEYRCKLSYKVAKFVTSDCTVCARSFYSSGNITYCPLVVSPYFSRQKTSSSDHKPHWLLGGQTSGY